MGVLSGYRVIELAGIGPGPMCAMLLSDMGADVLRIDRMADAGLGIAMDQKYSLLNRGRRSVAFDLKKPEAIEAEPAAELETGQPPRIEEPAQADGYSPAPAFAAASSAVLRSSPASCFAANARACSSGRAPSEADLAFASASSADFLANSATRDVVSASVSGSPTRILD